MTAGFAIGRTGLRAVMVDVDGVLIKGRPADGLHWSTGLEADLHIPAEALHQRFFARYWSAIVTGRDDLRTRLGEVLPQIAPQVAVDQLVDYWFRNDAAIDTRLLADLAEVRRTGIQVHLATNQEHERARYLLDTLGFAAATDGCHYSAALGCCKPERAFYDAVVRRTGFAPAQLLLLDDTAGNVDAARDAGWNAILWTERSGLATALDAASLGRSDV